MTIGKRRTVPGAGILLVAAAVLLAGCASSAPGGGDTALPDDAGEPTLGGTLVVSFADDDNCRDPNQSSRHESRIIARNVVDNLTDQDPETGEIVPWIAESWEISDDATEYTFHLRDGVTFSDGAALDAAAVKTAFDSIVALGAKSVLGYSYLAVGYVGTEVVDDETVKVVFDRPNAQFLQATSSPTLGILSPDSYAKTPEERCNGDFSGSGAFVQTNYAPDAQLDLERRDDYAWPSSLDENQGAAYLDGITIKFISETGVRIGELIQGTTDIDNARRPSYPAQYTQAEIDQLEASGATIVRRGIPGVSVRIPNTTIAPFDDPLVREAFAHAIDRTVYATALNDTKKKPAAGLLASSTPGYIDYADEYAYDPELVDELLTEAGWKKNAEGIWEKDGKTLDVELIVTGQSTGVDLLQSLAVSSGFNVTQRVVTQAESTEITQSGQAPLGGAVVTRADADILRNYLDPAAGNIYSKIAIPDDLKDEVTALFARTLEQTDPEARNATFKEVQDLLVENYLVFPDDDRELTAALRPNVHGFQWTAEAFFNLHGVWLDDES